MVQGEGRRRLRLVLGIANAVACALSMALVLIFYGAPYKPLWWITMGLILVGAFFAARLIAAPLEWVIEGYRDDASGAKPVSEARR